MISHLLCHRTPRTKRSSNLCLRHQRLRACRGLDFDWIPFSTLETAARNTGKWIHMKSFHKTSLLAEREPAKSGVRSRKKSEPSCISKGMRRPEKTLSFFPPTALVQISLLLAICIKVIYYLQNCWLHACTTETFRQRKNHIDSGPTILKCSWTFFLSPSDYSNFFDWAEQILSPCDGGSREIMIELNNLWFLSPDDGGHKFITELNSSYCLMMIHSFVPWMEPVVAKRDRGSIDPEADKACRSSLGRWWPGPARDD